MSFKNATVFSMPPAGDRADEDHEYRDDHDHALDQVGGADGEVSAGEGVDEDEQRADDHHRCVVHIEERGEELAAGGEATADVDAEEEEDDEGRDGLDDALLVAETVREEARDRNRVIRLLRILAQPLGYEEPVEVGSDCEADGRPHRIRRAAEVGNARQAHQQPAAHVRRLCRERGCPDANLAPSEEIVLGRLVRTPGEVESDDQDHDDVNAHHGKRDHISMTHDSSQDRANIDENQ